MSRTCISHRRPWPMAIHYVVWLRGAWFQLCDYKRNGNGTLCCSLVPLPYLHQSIYVIIWVVLKEIIAFCLFARSVKRKRDCNKGSPRRWRPFCWEPFVSYRAYLLQGWLPYGKQIGDVTPSGCAPAHGLGDGGPHLEKHPAMCISYWSHSLLPSGSSVCGTMVWPGIVIRFILTFQGLPFLMRCCLLSHNLSPRHTGPAAWRW